MQSASPLLRLHGVTHRFGVVTALWNVDLEVFPGDFLAIFGPNGAGKTTLLKVVATLVKPSEGTVEYPGVQASRRQVGYVSHQSLLYNELTGYENLLFYARLYQVPSPEAVCRRLLERMGLEESGDRLARTYSRGMRQRLTLARALVHDPVLLLLDEPYTGLDQHGCRLLTEVLESLKAESRTVLLITHNLNEGLELSNRVLIQHRGEVVYQAQRNEVSLESLEAVYFDVVSPGARAAGAAP